MEKAWLEKLYEMSSGKENPPDVRIGIGDDAAVLERINDSLVLSVDMLGEGVDFIFGEVDLRLIGRKSIAVNLSDLAAMAAVPIGVLVAVSLPKTGAFELAEKLYEGMNGLLEEYSIPMIGGDTNTWNGGLVISVTAIGKTTALGPLRRSGAKAGDRIIVSGSFGGSILERQFLFEPRIRESLFLHENYELHAGMDVSDGLSLDLFRMAEASGLGAVLEEQNVPIHPDVDRLPETGKTRLEHALGDGEDFELLLAVPSETAKLLIETQPLDVPLSDIGCFTEQKGLFIRKPNDDIRPLRPQGFEH